MTSNFIPRFYCRRTLTYVQGIITSYCCHFNISIVAKQLLFALETVRAYRAFFLRCLSCNDQTVNISVSSLAISSENIKSQKKNNDINCLTIIKHICVKLFPNLVTFGIGKNRLERFMAFSNPYFNCALHHLQLTKRALRFVHAFKCGLGHLRFMIIRFRSCRTFQCHPDAVSQQNRPQ